MSTITTMTLARGMKEETIIKDLLALKPCGIYQRSDETFKVLSAKVNNEVITVFYGHDDIRDFAQIDNSCMSDDIWLSVYGSNIAKQYGCNMLYTRR